MARKYKVLCNNCDGKEQPLLFFVAMGAGSRGIWSSQQAFIASCTL
jgi:hypothetical protein